MMELRYIGEVPHIITRVGTKLEKAMKTADVVDQARLRIQDAQQMLTNLERSKAEAQSGLEAALLKGDPTAPYRAEIANITELVIDQEHEISDSVADIAYVHQVLDHHNATRIQLADVDAIATLVKPFTDFLETQK